MKDNAHTVECLLKQYKDPYLNTDLVTTGAIKNIEIDDDKVVLDIELGFPSTVYQSELEEALKAILQPLQRSIVVKVTTRIVSHAVQPGLRVLPTVKNIIAIASGKGGVGKSTTAVNLALALRAEGARVGLLDADIYGPSQPQMLGAKTRPDSVEGQLTPVVCYGIPSMSIGYLIEQKDTPVIWRGPMVTRALQQLLHDTLWGELDYLVVDLPPGTGDIQLTLSQKIPVTGALIVTTPQEIALLDARKAYNMFGKVKIPVVGIIENMSYAVCSHCGEQEYFFGQGGGEQMAKDYTLPLLGQIPLVRTLREQVDHGRPTVVAEPDSAISMMYRLMARRVAARLALQANDQMHCFPKIVIEN